MTSEFTYSTTFILDKNYFTECFEQSVDVDHTWQAYFKAIFFSVFGGLLVLFTPINPYVAWFLFGIGIIEALSVYYQKPWWVTRQMLGKASKSEVTLTVDTKGINSHSFYVDDSYEWQDISKITATDKGWIIQHAKGKNYISARFLNAQASQYIQDKAQEINKTAT
jgi:hypothetical protein